MSNVDRKKNPEMGESVDEPDQPEQPDEPIDPNVRSTIYQEFEAVNRWNGWIVQVSLTRQSRGKSTMMWEEYSLRIKQTPSEDSENS